MGGREPVGAAGMMAVFANCPRPRPLATFTAYERLPGSRRGFGQVAMMGSRALPAPAPAEMTQAEFLQLASDTAAFQRKLTEIRGTIEETREAARALADERSRFEAAKV